MNFFPFLGILCVPITLLTKYTNISHSVRLSAAILDAILNSNKANMEQMWHQCLPLEQRKPISHEFPCFLGILCVPKAYFSKKYPF